MSGVSQQRIRIDESPLRFDEVKDFAFARTEAASVEISHETQARVERAHKHLLNLLERRIPIYGVTTGFGDSCHRFVTPERSEELQRNLVAYLSCGTGDPLPEEASRATFLIRLKSLSLGYSGVSPALLERMKLFLERGWTPVVPREGSLGASGDLIPLAYIARALQGEGYLHGPDGSARLASAVLAENGVAPYKLKAKEGLALVNGTSSMAGLCVVNTTHARNLVRLSTIASAWTCLVLGGKREAFGELVNEKAKRHAGQARIAREIRMLLDDENYRPKAGQDVSVRDNTTDGYVQDRYSLRCSPQILGPVIETIEKSCAWIEDEINSATDNPLIDDDGSLGMGGNFYGGYLGHSMDYLKICLAHVADLTDRQLMLVIDDKSNRGLTPNLAAWDSLSAEERHLHHGLKGLHQAVNAITSEILPKAVPNGIFSRSSESHNQDKVSLGMSAAVQCMEMTGALYRVMTMHLTCLAQALDLRGIKLQGEDSLKLYETIRSTIPFVTRDASLGERIQALSIKLKETAVNHS